MLLGKDDLNLEDRRLYTNTSESLWPKLFSFSPLFWRSSGGDFLRCACSLGIPVRVPSNLRQSPIFANTPFKSTCLYCDLSLHTFETIVSTICCCVPNMSAAVVTIERRVPQSQSWSHKQTHELVKPVAPPMTKWQDVPCQAAIAAEARVVELWSQFATNYTGSALRNLSEQKKVSKVTLAKRPQSDPKVAQKWPHFEPILSQSRSRFSLTFGSLYHPFQNHDTHENIILKSLGDCSCSFQRSADLICITVTVSLFFCRIQIQRIISLRNFMNLLQLQLHDLI